MSRELETIPIDCGAIDPPKHKIEPTWIELTKKEYDALFDIKTETVKFLGEPFLRETFESLSARKASEMEFAMNGFITIKESQ